MSRTETVEADFEDELNCTATVIPDWWDRIKILFGWHLVVRTRIKVTVVSAKKMVIPQRDAQSEVWTYNPRRKPRPMTRQSDARDTASS